MSLFLNHIEEQARSLSAEDRQRLAVIMMESLHTSIEEIETAFPEEIAVRTTTFDKRDIPAYTAEQVCAEARNILR